MLKYSDMRTTASGVTGIARCRREGAEPPTGHALAWQEGRSISLFSTIKVKQSNIITSCFFFKLITGIRFCHKSSNYNMLIIGYYCCITEHLPDVIYWKYDSSYLLPSSISLESFRTNPSACIPLKSMFNLAGYEQINEAISNAIGRTNSITNILNKVSRKSTEYLHTVWSDYQNVKFELRLNGSNIDIFIQDAENFYGCDQRSDGFKRFVTILLALSARVNNGEIEDAIIIIDEPDLGIHILGQRNLVQELIKISQKNLVFYSTHSIFMIDREQPSRHFIVSKRNEITTIKQVTESIYTDDEVIFNALGYTIFETLKKKNIIFEGWADKRVFELITKTKKSKNISKFDELGRVHITGVKNIISITKVLELANREYFVISDSDYPAKAKRKSFQQEEQCNGIWLTYEDLVPDIYTLEDFIKHAAYKESIEAACSKHSELKDFCKRQYKRYQKRAYQGYHLQANLNGYRVLFSGFRCASSVLPV